MCKDGHSEIAWFLVLLPFVLFFLIFISAASYYRKMNKQTKKQVEPLIL
jgi:Flp pilus assembly protein TadB